MIPHSCYAQDNQAKISLTALTVRCTRPEIVVGHQIQTPSSSLSSSALFLSPSSSSEPIDSVFSQDDLVVGTIIAVLLSVTVSFLQSRRSQNDFVLWPKDPTRENDGTSNDDGENMNVFDADSWKEMSRPENYVLYNTRLRSNNKIKNKTSQSSTKEPITEEVNEQIVPSLPTKSQSNKSATPETSGTTIGTTERRIVLFALLLLFVPIFSIEFFLTLSRQMLCDVGDPLQQSDWAVKLCSPVVVVNTPMR